MFRHTLIVGIVGILAATPLWAQPKADPKADAKKDAAKAPAGEALKVTVASVSGIAEKSSASDPKSKWTPVKAGDILNEFALIRTGLGGKVVLKFADRGNVTVKSSTKIGIASFRKQGKVVKARLGLKYGAISAEVDPTKGTNDFRIRTAVATLAAKASKTKAAQWGDFSFQAQVTRGGWQANIANKMTVVEAGEIVNKNLETPSIEIKVNQTATKVFDTHDAGVTTQEVKTIVVHSAIPSFTGTTNNTPAPRLVQETPPKVPDLPTVPKHTQDALHGPTGGLDDPEYSFP